MSSIHERLHSTDSFRLLRLGLAVQGQLDYSLVAFDSYKTAPEYHAISYCWGNPDDTLDSFCNGYPFPITRSLHGALWCLSRKKLSQWIWADAVCINQSDLLERNQQVSIMQQIYQHAAHVFIWTGHEELHQPETTIKLIRNIGQAACHALHTSGSSSTSWLARSSNECDRSYMVSKLNFPNVTNTDDAEWRRFWQFYNSSWFSRVWVIQEVRGSGGIDLLLERESLEWDHVALAAKWVLSARDLSVDWRRSLFENYAGFNNVSFMWNRVKETRREAPFTALLNCLRHFCATDARDRVFALLQYPVIQVQADYKMTTYEVYRRMASECIRCYENLEVLTYAWQAGPDQDMYPSWIPRWGLANNHDHWTTLLPFLYDAAKGTRPVLRPTSNENVLSLQGLNLGCITETSTVLRFQNERTYSSSEHLDIEYSLLEMATIISQDRWQEDITVEDAAERASHQNTKSHFADFCTYVLNHMNGRQQDSYFPVYRTWCDLCKGYITPSYAAVSRLATSYQCYDCSEGEFAVCACCYKKGNHCTCPERPLKAGTTAAFWLPYTTEIIEICKNNANGDGDRFWRTARVMMRTREFFHTSYGWKGVGYNRIEPGDTLAVLFGSRVPFILRKIDNNVKNGYRLIGDCYIHGLMDGEAIQMWKDGDERAKLEYFALR